ncbi:hypothetical protein [Undibacterium macrobrachii]|uniref:hypothetical protein n=1 Tax=Undibacterium macrobrachii TaxID=1119058 RepID=UPI00167515CF|nr:hypothetical protein [Undibacterium macrobrachii]
MQWRIVRLVISPLMWDLWRSRGRSTSICNVFASFNARKVMGKWGLVVGFDVGFMAYIVYWMFAVWFPWKLESNFKLSFFDM